MANATRRLPAAAPPLAAALLLLAGLLLIGPAPASADPALQDQHGRAHALSEEGKVTVLDFAASWCEPCHRSLPRLQAFAAENPHLRVLVVSVDEKVEGRDELIERLGLSLPVIWDRNFALVKRFQPGGMPSTFVLDGEGKVIYQEVGFTEKKWEKLVAFLEGLGAGAG